MFHQAESLFQCMKWILHLMLKSRTYEWGRRPLKSLPLKAIPHDWWSSACPRQSVAQKEILHCPIHLWMKRFACSQCILHGPALPEELYVNCRPCSQEPPRSAPWWLMCENFRSWSIKQHLWIAARTPHASQYSESFSFMPSSCFSPSPASHSSRQSAKWGKGRMWDRLMGSQRAERLLLCPHMPPAGNSALECLPWPGLSSILMTWHLKEKLFKLSWVMKL